MNSSKIGRWGEELALKMLEAAGCELVCKNFWQNGGELDLVVRDGEYLAFVEVRARAVGSLTGPGESVDGEKRRRIASTTEGYLYKNPKLSVLQPRFDVVEVYLYEGLAERIEWHKNAFTLDDVPKTTRRREF